MCKVTFARLQPSLCAAAAAAAAAAVAAAAAAAAAAAHSYSLVSPITLCDHLLEKACWISKNAALWLNITTRIELPSFLRVCELCE